MIWIATLLLLAIAAWFLLEGNNERRWVEDHQHDETVAADRGYLPGLDKLNKSSEPTDRYSAVASDNGVGRFANKMRDKTSKIGDAIEQRTASATTGAGETPNDAKRQKRRERGNALTGPDSLIGRTAQRIADKTDAISDKIPEGRLVSDSRYGEQEPSGMRRFINSVESKLERIDDKVQ